VTNQLADVVKLKKDDNFQETGKSHGEMLTKEDICGYLVHCTYIKDSLGMSTKVWNCACAFCFLPDKFRKYIFTI